MWTDVQDDTGIISLSPRLNVTAGPKSVAGTMDAAILRRSML